MPAHKPRVPIEAIELYNRYIHGEIGRRDFLNGVKRFAIAGLTAGAIVEALTPNYAAAQQVSKTDDRIKASYETIPSPKGNGSIKGYLVRPFSADTRAATAAKLPGVLVVHENRGLNPHIEDIARRIALEGFVAFAPDALTSAGGYPGDEDKARELFSKLDQAKAREDFLAAYATLKARPDCTGKIGVVGFCYGGGISNMLATRVPDLAAAVPFYGMQPKPEDVAHIKAPLLLHYAEKDDRINAGIAAYEEALKANHVKYQLFKYAGTQHGFNNDTTPRYDKAAAALAWERTLAFFKKNLRG